MSFIDIATFDTALVHCETVYSKAQQPGEKPKPRVKISYGPSRRSLAFISPPTVVDWPRLHGDGNFGTKFGPTDVDKAQFTVALTDKPLPATGVAETGPLFDVLEAVDAALVAFVHANQKEFLSTLKLSPAEVKGKMNATVKSKFDDTDTLAYRRVNLATRKFDWKGQERTLRIVDAKRAPVTDDIVEHDDICMIALQLDCVYTGLMGAMFGCKWNVCEVMLVQRAPPRSAMIAEDVWGAVEVPAWAASADTAGFF